MNRKNKTASAGCRLLMFLLLLPLLLAAGCTKDGGNEEVIPPKATDPTAAGKDTTGAMKPNEKNEVNGGVIISSSILLRVSDAQGNDLLDPASTSPKAVDASKIKLYYVKVGKEELHYNVQSDKPTGISLYTPESTFRPYYMIKIGLNHEAKETITTSILEWPDGRRDALKAEFYRQSNPTTQVIVQKVWLNDKLIWDRMKNSRWEPYQITR